MNETKLAEDVQTRLAKMFSDWATSGSDKTGLQTVEEFLAQELAAAVTAECERIRKIVDSVKKDIWHLKKQGVLEIGGEKLDLITKYQALNMINLNDLPYTAAADYQLSPTDQKETQT